MGIWITKLYPFKSIIWKKYQLLGGQSSNKVYYVLDLCSKYLNAKVVRLETMYQFLAVLRPQVFETSTCTLQFHTDRLGRRNARIIGSFWNKIYTPLLFLVGIESEVWL